MIKLFFATTFAFFSFISTFTAHAQHAVEGRPIESPVLKRMPVAEIKNPVFLKGNLASWVNKSNEFVVYAETKDKKYYFVLQNKQRRNIKPATGKFTEISFFNSGMILSDGKNIYYFGLQNNDDLIKLAHYTDKDFIAKVEGYGLSIHTVPLTDKNVSLDKLKALDSVSD